MQDALQFFVTRIGPDAFRLVVMDAGCILRAFDAREGAIFGLIEYELTRLKIIGTANDNPRRPDKEGA
jgi:hypothetical protein